MSLPDTVAVDVRVPGSELLLAVVSALTESPDSLKGPQNGGLHQNRSTKKQDGCRRDSKRPGSGPGVRRRGSRHILLVPVVPEEGPGSYVGLPVVLSPAPTASTLLRRRRVGGTGTQGLGTNRPGGSSKTEPKEWCGTPLDPSRPGVGRTDPSGHTVDGYVGTVSDPYPVTARGPETGGLKVPI